MVSEARGRRLILLQFNTQKYIKKIDTVAPKKSA
jgi:hypothetical protein